MAIPDPKKLDINLSSKAKMPPSDAQIALVDALCRENKGLRRPEMNALAVSRWLDDVLDRLEPDEPATVIHEDFGQWSEYYGENFTEFGC